ncbi:MAG: NAD-binding protein, partial [Pirellulaceae bacterium]|nr:NAD-binding protein [Pirellulaceae bacterium]
MRTPVERLRLGGIILGVIVVTSVLGYRFLGHYEWMEAVWMVVISITSVGYGERSTEPWYMQLFTVAVVLLGISAAGYTFGGFLQILLAGELEDAMGHRKMKQQIDRLSGHTIICGFGRIGRTLADDMHRHQQRFVIIEQNEENLSAAREAGYFCLHGDATEDELLLAAGCQRAKALITGLPNDAANVFITLTARNLNRDLLIVARAGHGSSERKLRQAGADKVVLPSAIGAQLMSRMIMRPTTADLMELVAEKGNLNVQLEEMQVSEPCN